MAKLLYLTRTSLDGYIADDGNFEPVLPGNVRVKLDERRFAGPAHREVRDRFRIRSQILSVRFI